MIPRMTALLILVMGTALLAEDIPEITNVKPKDVPQNIRDVATKEFPTFKIEEAAFETRKTGKVYFIAFTHPTDGDKYGDVTIDEKGKILAKAYSIALDKVPPQIRAIAIKAFPNYEVGDAVFEKNEAGDMVSLSLEHKTIDDKYAEITIDLKGTIVGKGHAITPQEVPDVVRKSLAKTYTVAKIIDANYYVDFRDNKKTESYSVTIQIPGEVRYVDFDKQGKIIADLSEDEM